MIETEAHEYAQKNLFRHVCYSNTACRTSSVCHAILHAIQQKVLQALISVAHLQVQAQNCILTTPEGLLPDSLSLPSSTACRREHEGGAHGGSYVILAADFAALPAL